MGSDPKQFKIFPRNLTARADFLVRGNPISTRPESGVNNCYPGLEFDQRNLDQRFFPGLTFYFHRDDGAMLTDIALSDEQRFSGLSLRDIPPNRPLFLWAMFGRTLVQDPEPSLFGFRGQSGMEVWRRVTDLLPGRVSLLFGPTPGFSIDFGADLSALDVEETLKSAYGADEPRKRCFVVRDRTGNLLYGVFAGDRANYLDENGVIDTSTYSPGELTKTMCAPWMYDFRDCYCFYWSSNKPDIVDSADGKHSYLNFIRSTTLRQLDPPPPDTNFYFKTVDGKRVQRRDYELTYQDMVEGWWHRLPVVLNDKESEVFVPPEGPQVSELLTFEEAAHELDYLATVEHALTVEYLYAYFSLNSPMKEAATADPVDRRISAAASQVFQIAVDEMRHFLWANMALAMLGKPPSTGRASVIAEPPSTAGGRKQFTLVRKQYLARPFELKPLTPETLAWFVAVEAPSRKANEGLDGMYVELLASIQGQPDLFPQHEHLSPIIKLIADEGEGHWKRFVEVQRTLEGMSPDRYLRRLAAGSPSALQQSYLDICNQYYGTILDAIEISFALKPQQGGQLVREAVRSMRNLQEVAFVVATDGFLPTFDLPQRDRKIPSHEEAVQMLSDRQEKIGSALSLLSQHGKEPARQMSLRHHRVASEQFAQYFQLVGQGFGTE